MLGDRHIGSTIKCERNALGLMKEAFAAQPHSVVEIPGD